VENYFNYFTEVEEHFCRRRGTYLQVSTLDWQLIEVWKDSGIPLESVLRGIDDAFDRYDKRPSKTRKINGLAWCAQAVLAAAEDMKEAAVGAYTENIRQRSEQGFDQNTLTTFLLKNAGALEVAQLPDRSGISARVVAEETAGTLRNLTAQLITNGLAPRLQDLEHHLTVLEERLFAVLLAVTPDEDAIAVRAAADREVAPYRSKMPPSQVEELRKRYVQKRLLEKYGLPRLSLFYM
jgi:hypothetical protein